MEEGNAKLVKTESPPDTEVNIEFELRVQPPLLEDYIPEGESVENDYRMVVLISAHGLKAARLRNCEPVELAESSGGELVFRGVWSSTRSDISGDLLFQPSLVRRYKGSDPAFSQFPGEEMAGSDDSLTLSITEPQPVAGGDIDIRWIDFPEKRPDDVGRAWVLDAKGSSDTPRLLLDSSINGFRTTLANEATRGDTARRRDLLMAMIASEVWTSLATSALTALTNQSGSSGEEAEFQDDDWRQRLLMDVASHVHPDMEAEEGIETLLTDYREDPIRSAAEIACVVQERYETRKFVERSVELSAGSS
jgi:hypothetical protein